MNDIVKELQDTLTTLADNQKKITDMLSARVSALENTTDNLLLVMDSVLEKMGLPKNYLVSQTLIGLNLLRNNVNGVSEEWKAAMDATIAKITAININDSKAS